jgi:hypothetical protein
MKFPNQRQEENFNTENAQKNGMYINPESDGLRIEISAKLVKELRKKCHGRTWKFKILMIIKEIEGRGNKQNK